MKDLSECRILIVDDVKANVDVLVEALRGDYKLSVALDGASALRSVEKNPPDLVLLDIMMPGIDGYEVCRRLRESEQTRDIPVMFLTSLEDVQNKARGFEIGAKRLPHETLRNSRGEGKGPVAGQGQGVRRCDQGSHGRWS